MHNMMAELVRRIERVDVVTLLIKRIRTSDYRYGSAVSVPSANRHEGCRQRIAFPSAVPIFTDHVRACRLAMIELHKERRVNASEVTESEEFDRLLASHYKRGKVRLSYSDSADM